MLSFLHLVFRVKKQVLPWKGIQVFADESCDDFSRDPCLWQIPFPHFSVSVSLCSHLATGTPARHWCRGSTSAFTSVNQTSFTDADWNAFICNRWCLAQTPLNQKIVYHRFQVHNSEKKGKGHIYAWGYIASPHLSRRCIKVFGLQGF